MKKIRDGDLCIAPNGNDAWSGRLPEPNPEGTDGPLASVRRAQFLARQFRRRAMLQDSITVWIRGGHYVLNLPLQFGPEDSGAMTYAAYPGEQPIFSGGVRVTGWCQHKIGSAVAWEADVSKLIQGRDIFRSLFVNGQRRPRARFPKKDCFEIADVPDNKPSPKQFDGCYRFKTRPGDIRQWENLHDAEIVAFHAWVEERLPIADFDERTNMVKCSKKSIFTLNQGTRYYVENIFEALSEPGEWYLNRNTGMLYYLPMPGEIMEDTDVTVPLLFQFLRIIGDPESNQYVEGLRFDGLAFEHSDWFQPSHWWGKWFDPYTPKETWAPCDSFRHFNMADGADPYSDYAAAPQSAFHLPGAIHMRGVKNITFQNCRIAHIGYYGVGLGEGCLGNRIIGNTITDMGAGGILVNGSSVEGSEKRQTGRNRITDNRISGGGWVFPSACGIIIVNGFRNIMAHNDISDLCYTGISCGWIWGYDDNISRDNIIEKNHIHDLGRRDVLGDMGGIYVLGVQPGTCVSGNLIHDIHGLYACWGIYPDEGSSCIVFEDNIVYNTKSHSLHEHWGRQNIYRNNIFALPGEGGVMLNRETHSGWVDYPRHGCTFERNIIVTAGQPMFEDIDRYLDDNELVSDLNLFWDLQRPQPVIWHYLPHHAKDCRSYSLGDMQKKGHEINSMAADPKIKDLKNGDFTIAPDSPALKLGFKPINMSDIGPRPEGERDHLR